MKKNMKKVFAVFLLCILFFSFSNTARAEINHSYAEDLVTYQEYQLNESVSDSKIMEYVARFIYACGNLIEDLVANLFGTITSNMDPYFPWEDLIIFNCIPFLDINFINPADGSIFSTAIAGGRIGNVVRNVYYTILTLSIGLISLGVIVTAIRLAISSIAAEKAKYKQAIVSCLYTVIMIFSMHFILSFIFYMNEQIVEMASKILDSAFTSEDYQAYVLGGYDATNVVETFFNAADTTNLFSTSNLHNNKGVISDMIIALIDVNLYDFGLTPLQLWQLSEGKYDSMDVLKLTRTHALSPDTVTTMSVGDLNADNDVFLNNTESSPWINDAMYAAAQKGYFRKKHAIDETGSDDIITRQKIFSALWRSDEFNDVMKKLSSSYFQNNFPEYKGKSPYDQGPSYANNGYWIKTEWQNGLGWDTKMNLSIESTGIEGCIAIVYCADMVQEICDGDITGSNYYINGGNGSSEEKKLGKFMTKLKDQIYGDNAGASNIISTLADSFKRGFKTLAGSSAVGTTVDYDPVAATLYFMLVIQSLMFLFAYIKRLFYVVMLSLLGPVVIIYDFLMGQF